MHFTREPIIETIISARDGHKLVLKSSKALSSPEISAEVIEVVSFSGAVFYRSQDRSKNFLLPASDYEMTEIKDARLVLKNISLEKSNKLNNPSREPAIRESSDEGTVEEEVSAEIEGTEEGASSAPASGSPRTERRRERRRNRRRRHQEDRGDERKEGQAQPEEAAARSDDASDSQEGIQAAYVPPVIQLIPPPTTLISQTLARYKDLVQEEPSAPTAVVENVPDQGSVQETLEPEDLV